MELSLGKNIRKMRKERGLTQESLAEALGVTNGAVYKWEANQSVPELEMIVKLADLFDVSLDVLLGYEKINKHKDVLIQNIYIKINTKDITGLEDADRALLKYPNDYGILMVAASIYACFGTEEKNRELKQRAIELYKKALDVIPSGIDPRYGELMIQRNIALIYHSMDEKEQAGQILKEHNEAGIFNAEIGLLMALNGDKSDECKKYLMDSCIQSISNMLNMSIGFIIFYVNHGDFEKVRSVSKWSIDCLDRLNAGNEINYLDKVKCAFLTCYGYAVFRLEGEEKGEKQLVKARTLARKFDASPDFSIYTKFYDSKEKASSYDSFGKTANEAIETALDFINDRKFKSLWKKLNG